MMNININFNFVHPVQRQVCLAWTQGETLICEDVFKGKSENNVFVIL